MRTLVCIIVLFLSLGGFFWGSLAGAAKDSEIEVVEVIEVVEPEEGTGSGLFLGIPKHRWMTITGPLIWMAMALAIVTRYIQIKGKTRQLFKAHRVFGYTAFCVGTCHGLFGLLL
ncbi:hypothetical protein ACFL4N_05310 [Thermodesulfobacteriota bacterium]